MHIINAPDSPAPVITEHQQKLRHQYQVELKRCLRGFAKDINPGQGVATDEEAAARHWNEEWRKYCHILDKQKPTIPTDHDAFTNAVKGFNEQRAAAQEAARPLGEVKLGEFGFEPITGSQPPLWLAHNMAVALHSNGDVALYLKPSDDPTWPTGLPDRKPVLVPGLTLAQLGELVKLLRMEQPRRPDSIAFERACKRQRRSWFMR